LQINKQSWDWPEVFTWLQGLAHIDEQEMLRTFNCGIGMVVCVDENDLDGALTQFDQLGESAWHLGSVIPKQTKTLVWQ